MAEIDLAFKVSDSFYIPTIVWISVLNLRFIFRGLKVSFQQQANYKIPNVWFISIVQKSIEGGVTLMGGHHFEGVEQFLKGLLEAEMQWCAKMYLRWVPGDGLRLVFVFDKNMYRWAPVNLKLIKQVIFFQIN